MRCHFISHKLDFFSQVFDASFVFVSQAQQSNSDADLEMFKVKAKQLLLQLQALRAMLDRPDQLQVNINYSKSLFAPFQAFDIQNHKQNMRLLFIIF